MKNQNEAYCNMWINTDTHRHSVQFQYNAVLTHLDKVSREDAPLSSQLPLQPSLLAGLGDFLDHVPCPHCDLVSHGAFEVYQHQHLYSRAANGAEN